MALPFLILPAIIHNVMIFQGRLFGGFTYFTFSQRIETGSPTPSKRVF